MFNKNTISDDILDWINDQRDAGLAETTINNRELLVREMYEYFITDVSSARKDLPWSKRNFTGRQYKKLPRYLTFQQVIR